MHSFSPLKSSQRRVQQLAERERPWRLVVEVSHPWAHRPPNFSQASSTQESCPWGRPLPPQTLPPHQSQSLCVSPHFQIEHMGTLLAKPFKGISQRTGNLSTVFAELTFWCRSTALGTLGRCHKTAWTQWQVDIRVPAWPGSQRELASWPADSCLLTVSVHSGHRERAPFSLSA